MIGGGSDADLIAKLQRDNAMLERRLLERTVELEEIARSAITDLARTNAELESRLAERTIERDAVAREVALAELERTTVLENAFRVHNAELEELNAELESFSYSVSHDLRAPVRAIIGFAQAVEEDYASVLDAEGRRLLAIVQSEATRMGDLIDDLLAFSRLGRQAVVDGFVDMTVLAREVASELEPAPGTGEATITIETLPQIRGDRVLLRQVWVNLLSNALKYSGRQAHPHVFVWGTVETERVVYNVRDNGVGFDMAYADKLFGVFQRLHRSDEFPGSGVGLAIVKRIVSRHRGTVWAESRLGEGATFSFAIPTVRVV